MPSALDTALMEAVSRGDWIKTKALLAEGADATTALLKAATTGNREIVHLLLDRGARVNEIYPTYEVIDRTRYDEITTALIAAAQGGHLSVVELLLAQGADPNIAGIFCGTTALLAAAVGGHIAVAQRLVAAGADLNARDRYCNSTALDYALNRNFPELATWLAVIGAQRAPGR